MFTIFKEEKVITTGILVFLGLSILVRLLLAGFYHTMIKETDNMATTNNRLLKQCKVKFANCYQLNGGVSNIPVFVDKFLNRLAFGHLSFDAWYHLSGQCMLFSIVFAGVGICKGIMGGRMLGEILPFYIVSFLGMYLYFSLSAMVDIKGKRRILKTNLIDYLENHLSGRIPVTEQDYERLYGPGSLVEEIATSGKAGRRQRTSGGTDADPQQSGAAGGDVRSSGQRSIFHGKCNARKGGRQGDNRTAGGSRQSHGGRITGIASGITYSIAENVRRPKEFRKHSPDL